MTRVVTDGAADLPDALVAAAHITVARGTVRRGDRPWLCDRQQFWAELRKGGDLPATDAPSVDQLADAYAGEEAVLAVHVSAELSRTVAHAEEAALVVGAGRARIRVVDSRSLSVGTGLLALAAAEAAQAGVGGDRLAATVEEWVDQLHVHALIDDADLLAHAGRAGLVGAEAGRRAHRHVVAVKGHVIPIRQVRHRREALEGLIGHIARHVGAPPDAGARAAGGAARWAVGHGDATDVGELVERLAAVFGCDPYYVTLLGAPVGSHMGPGSLVVGFFSNA